MFSPEVQFNNATRINVEQKAIETLNTNHKNIIKNEDSFILHKKLNSSTSNLSEKSSVTILNSNSSIRNGDALTPNSNNFLKNY